MHWRRVGARGAADGSKKRVLVGSWILINWPASCLKVPISGHKFCITDPRMHPTRFRGLI